MNDPMKLIWKYKNNNKKTIIKNNNKKIKKLTKKTNWDENPIYGTKNAIRLFFIRLCCSDRRTKSSCRARRKVKIHAFGSTIKSRHLANRTSYKQGDRCKC